MDSVLLLRVGQVAHVSILSFCVGHVFELLFYVADGSVLSNSVDDGSILSATYYCRVNTVSKDRKRLPKLKAAIFV